jgi:ATP-binding cassette, subfamily B, bacterial HlyB/CyaB
VGERLVNLLNQRFRYQKLSNNVNLTGGMIQTIASTALLWYGAMLVIQGQLTIGQFVAFNMLIGNVLSPMLAVVGVWDEFQEVLIAIERLNDVFAATPEDVRSTPPKITGFISQDSADHACVPLAQTAIPSIMGEVRFDRVVFAYDGLEEDPTISNLSFTVQPGQTVAIVGRSGSGKSTLVKLLQGLYLPTKGRILIDGYGTDQVSPQSLRSQLGVVPQDCFLFSGSVAENIQLYRSDYALDQITHAAKLAEAHAFIQELPLGYQTKVGERGANLSGGQRQRVAIARALLGDPAMLILDEATSALDTESERRFQQNLDRISRDRTTFIIAHRLSTVQRADLILVLDRGLLVEQGNHAELMERRGLYFHLAQQQLAS